VSRFAAARARSAAAQEILGAVCHFSFLPQPRMRGGPHAFSGCEQFGTVAVPAAWNRAVSLE